MIANHKGEIPFVVLIIPFLLGLGMGLNYLSIAYYFPLVILLFSLCLVFILLNLTYQKFNIYKIRWLGGTLINVIIFLFGCISVIHYSELNKPTHFSKLPAQYMLVNVSNEPVLKNGFLRFTARAEENINKDKGSPATGTLLISLKDSLAKSLYYGDELLIPANYAPVDPPYNPAEFNYKNYLAAKNIYYQAFLYHGQYKLISHNTGNAPVAFSLRLRQKLVDKFKTNMHDNDAIAIVSTLVLGYKADLSNDVVQAYATTGAIHILTISGMHVAIIYFLLSFAFSFLNRYKYGKLIKAVLIIGLIWYYALLTGLAAPVCRAAVIISFIIIGRNYNRYINRLNILAVSAFVMLLFDPFLISDVGFQLAYIAIGGLIILRPIVYQWFHFKNKWARKLWGLCSISIAVQVIIFPLSAFYFHQFPVYFLVSNVFVIIPFTIIIYTGILYLLLPQIPFISKALGYVLEKTALLMNKVLSAIEHAPLAAINKIWINTGEYLLLYAIIISLFYFLYDKKTWMLKLSLCCILLLSISTGYKKIHSLSSDSIAFLSLHKHVGIVAKSSDEAVVISDLSDTDKNYKYSIQPYLDSSGITKVSLYDIKQNITSPFLVKKGSLIQFDNKKILIFNKQLDAVLLNKKLNVDYLYVTGSPYADINSINKNFTYKALVIDGSNNNKYINTLQHQAQELNINYQVLKRNKSIPAVSN